MCNVEKEMPDWLLNPQSIKPEDIDTENIAKIDSAILKANMYFQKKYWPPKMIEIPIGDNSVIQCFSMPPVELFWTPSRHHPHENVSYAIIWGYNVRNLHHGINTPSPAYVVYHGPIDSWIKRFSESPEALDEAEKYVLDNQLSA